MEFEKFCKNFGVIDNNISFKNLNNIESVNYLKKILEENSKKYDFMNLFKSFIYQDNLKIIKLFKKILIIFLRNKRKNLLKYFFKWKKNLFFSNKPKKTIKKRNLSININDYKNYSKNFNINNKNRTKNFFEHLYQDSFNRKEKLKNLSLQKEEKFNTIYTFSPHLIKNKKFIINENFFDRINDFNKNKYENIKRIKTELNEKRTNENKFNFNQNYKNIKSKNDSNNFIQNKKIHIDYLLKNIYNEKGITFKPKLNENINNKIVKENVLKRNENFLNNKEKKINDLKNQKDINCTFNPKINKNKNKIYNNFYVNNEKQNFLNYNKTRSVSERLYNYKNYYKKNLDNIKKNYRENYSFKPILNNNIKINNKNNIIIDTSKFNKNLNSFNSDIVNFNLQNSFSERKNESNNNSYEKKHAKLSTNLTSTTNNNIESKSKNYSNNFNNNNNNNYNKLIKNLDYYEEIQ